MCQLLLNLHSSGVVYGNITPSSFRGKSGRYGPSTSGDAEALGYCLMHHLSGSGLPWLEEPFASDPHAALDIKALAAMGCEQMGPDGQRLHWSPAAEVTVWGASIYASSDAKEMDPDRVHARAALDREERRMTRRGEEFRAQIERDTAAMRATIKATGDEILLKARGKADELLQQEAQRVAAWIAAGKGPWTEEEIEERKTQWQVELDAYVKEVKQAELEPVKHAIERLDAEQRKCRKVHHQEYEQDRVAWRQFQERVLAESPQLKAAVQERIAAKEADVFDGIVCLEEYLVRRLLWKRVEAHARTAQIQTAGHIVKFATTAHVHV
ncbi:hypothetical protein WJX72_005706 [[Myrmecia] bisecta]|uniref:Uncharacterized protein n=1 Tax=[Myrmecia] bisecta TaxID=41462 RepID=A0AAW1PJW5_9CHLO